MNALERSGKTATSSTRASSTVPRLFKRTLWREVPRHSGHVRELFRNGLLLLLNAKDKDASILDFPRVSATTRFAPSCSACTNADVSFFWNDIVWRRGAMPTWTTAPYACAS